MVEQQFAAWFSLLAGDALRPHAWQALLAGDPSPRSRLVRIPTGMGKTLGVLAAWSWRRLHRQDDGWPRRLVWCLPMRVLVEQTEAVAVEALSRAGLLWDGQSDHAGKVGVHLLMGGTDAGGDWHLFPEECAVLIGTQDMLLSRAMNRGYGAGRARWPMEFGLLSHDALWVMDEVQLMDVGLATTAQLQAYLDEDARKGFRPRHTWWMSATLQPAWLKTVDTESHCGAWLDRPLAITPAQREASLGRRRKALQIAEIAATEHRDFASRVLQEHARVEPGEHGRISLVVCNRVDRARAVHRALREAAPSTQEIRLVHSQFRPVERAGWRDAFLSRAACSPGSDRVIVATQVVEAGVDISAGCVVTELAPWPSLVQRFGRCARYGGDGVCVVVDRGRDERDAPPYQPAELESALTALRELERSGAGVGLVSLESFEDSLDDNGRAALYPYSPGHLLLRREFDELFDTTPDVTGADLDISRFIRSGDERDVQLFWTDVPASGRRGQPPRPGPDRRPRRDELCAVPFLRARDWLCGTETSTKRQPRLRRAVRAWVWDWVDGDWAVADRAALLPGQIVAVAADSGGYAPAVGFDSDSRHPVVPVPSEPLDVGVVADESADRAHDTDSRSIAGWKTIACHGQEVREEVRRLAERAGVPDELREVLDLAAAWHDVGKAHPAFQGAIRRGDRPKRQDLAKAPDDAWMAPPGTYRTSDDRDSRPGFRHELASALALFAVLALHNPEHAALLGPWREVLGLLGAAVPPVPEAFEPTPEERRVLDCSAHAFDLLAYLVAAHHGKVRLALHPGPKDQDYPGSADGRSLPIRGVREGDRLPEVRLAQDGASIAALALTLEPAAMGLSVRTGRSWRERTLALQRRLGPGALAWLEAVFAAADRRASRLATPDPDITAQKEPR